MYISGIGILYTQGSGIDNFENNLRQGWVPPSIVKVPTIVDNPFFVYNIEPETLADKRIIKKTRRADRFCRMASLAAIDAIEDSSISFPDKKGSLGIVISTAFGPHVTTFRFLDDIIDFSDANVSPTLFSHSVHNAAASYIANILNCRGPTLTVTQFGFSFHHALIIAQNWLFEGRCNYVLVGAVDECGSVMEYICSQKIEIPKDGKIKPFDFSATPKAVPGEGSVFFLMTKNKKEYSKKYCEIHNVEITNDYENEDIPDISIIDADGMAQDETAYKNLLVSNNTYNPYIASYAPLFGSNMVGSSFHCAVAALILKKQTQYACPILNNPHALNLCTKTKQANTKKIHCIKYNCNHQKGVIKLKI